ncbi:MAG: sensor histidine kinase [Deltaproteobacteria bacterium]
MRIGKQLGVAFCAWTALALLFYARFPLQALATGQKVSIAIEPLISCWMWALITPAILALAERFPLERGKRGVNAAIHAAAALGSVIVSAPPTYALAKALGGRVASGLGTAMIAESFIDVFSYAAIVAVGHALAYHRISTREQLRRSELEARLLSARMEALEARMHPHFLFNALNTISSLIRTGDPKAAVRAVARLGDLMRSLLLDDGQEIPLAQEMDFVGRYLELEQARFGDKLSSHIDVDPAALEAMVPRLVLQPLVENALRHGIEPGRDPGRVEVRAARAGEMLELEVRDTGGGGVRGPSTSSTHVALANIRARLEQMYGERQELALTRREDGTVARVVIPYRAQR